MKDITMEKLNEILKLHKKWLECKKDGVRADLSDTNLYGMYLAGVNLESALLTRADFNHSDLRGANLRFAYADKANFEHARLDGADLTGVSLCDCSFRAAGLRETILEGAYLSGTRLDNIRLNGSKLNDIQINEYDFGFTNLCPQEGSFIGWKKGEKNSLIKLKIPTNAKRSNATSLKCRCDRAKVLAIYDCMGLPINEVASVHDYRFIYTVGKTVKVNNFDDDRWNECSTGIHFFIDKEMARRYEV